MHTEHFNTYHTRDHYPHWHCTRPTCVGTLQLDAGSLRAHMDYDARQRLDDQEYSFSQADDTGRYTAEFSCRVCGDGVMVVGRYGPEDWEIKGNEQTVEVFYPQYFEPPLPLIAVPASCPPTVREALTQAFATYWAAPGASANAIRVALERLMDALQIPKADNLHARLVDFAKRHPGPHADFLMAAKHVGNAGSHDGAAAHADVRDILHMVELTLGALYPPDHAPLLKQAAQFIQNKGRRP